MNQRPGAKQLLAAVRSGASADELNAMLAQIHEHNRREREARIQKDAELVATRIIAASPAVAATVEVLLIQAKQLLEGAA